MKKVSFLLLFFLVCIGVRAQIYLTQDFESAFTGTPAAPPGWSQTRIVLIGDGQPEIGNNTDGEKDWEQSTNTSPGVWSAAGSGGIHPQAAVSGSNALYLNDYYFGGTGNAFGARRMESPVINLSGATSPYVRFFLFCGYASNRMQLRIVASADGGTTWQTIAWVAPNADVTSFSSATPWQRINVRIPNAFHVTNCKVGLEITNSWGVQHYYIDDFSVEEFTPTTISSVASGAWNNPATWSGSVVPNADHHVIISAGHTVSLNVNIARMQNLTIDGTLTYSTTSASQLAQVFGSVSVSATGSLLSLSGTTGKIFYINESLNNNGHINFQPGTSTTGGIFWTGYNASYSGTGSIHNNRVPLVVHAVGNTVQYNNPFTISSSCGLYSGTVQVNNLTIGDPALTPTFIMERYRGIFSAAPVFNINNYTMIYRTPNNNLGGSFLAFPPAVINSSEEIPVVSGNRKVTTLTMATHDNLNLTYPLSVGTSTLGGITLTRGIIATSTTNLITFEPNVSGVVGTAPTYVVNTGTNAGTHGSYIHGPVKIHFPATGTTNRIFPLGQGFNLHNNMPSLNAHRPVTIGSSGVAWNSQTITATIENAPSGPVTGTLNTVMGTRAYRLNYNGGPALAPNHTVQLTAMNTGTTGGDNLLGDLADLRVAQAPALNGPWTERSLSSGSGPFANLTVYTRNTVSVTPGPLNPTDEYFAWATTSPLCSGTPSPGLITGSNSICQGSGTTLTLTSASSGVGISYQWASSSSPSGPFNPISGAVTNTLSTGSLSSTIYYVVTTSCSISSFTNVTPVFSLVINPPPTISVSASSTNYCFNSSPVTLTASGASSYTWSPASGLSATNVPVVSANPTVATIYSVSGTSTAGCTGPATTIHITANGVSLVNLSSNPSTLCPGGSVTLTSAINNTLNYCIPPYSNGTGSGDYINSVSLNTFTNSASGPLPSPFYTLYPASGFSTSLAAGNTYTLSVQSGSFTGASNFGAFIDYNQNGSFYDPGEKIAQINLTGSFANGSATFAVPAGATNGLTRLRVREVWNNTNIDPCSLGGWGETEDYFIEITGGNPPSNSYTWSPATFLSSTNTESTTANSVTTAISYTLQVTNMFGCSGQGTINLNVIPGPTLSVNHASVCFGQSATLTASGATSYSWSSGGTGTTEVVTPTSNTTYTVTGSNGTCQAQAIASVQVNALPGVTLSASQNTTCQNGSTVLLTGSPSGGTYSGTNVSGNVFNPSSTGTFTPVYSYTDASTGCSNTATITITVFNCSGLIETGSLSGVKFYPNPNTGIVFVNFNTEGNKTMILRDVSGKILQSRITDAFEYSLDMNDLVPGIYLLEIRIGETPQIFKLIKQQ